MAKKHKDNAISSSKHSQNNKNRQFIKQPLKPSDRKNVKNNVISVSDSAENIEFEQQYANLQKSQQIQSEQDQFQRPNKFAVLDQQQNNNQQQNMETNNYEQLSKQPKSFMEHEQIMIPTNLVISDQCQICILDTNTCFQIQNKTQQLAMISILSGEISINGKLYGCSLDYNLEKVFSIHSGSIIIDSTQQNNPSNQDVQIQIKGILHNIKDCLKSQIDVSVISQYLEKNYSCNLNQVVILLKPIEKLQIIKLKQSTSWENLKLSEFVGNDSKTTMLIGMKNTGKSTLCEYLVNLVQYRNMWQNKQDKYKNITNQICIIDCDSGRNQSYPGSVSLKYMKVIKNTAQNASPKIICSNKNIWVGEFTPLNLIPTYLHAVKQIYNIYRQKYYTSHLIINTMGYLTGIGQFMICQIFNIVKPHQILFMETKNNEKDKATNLKHIRELIQSGKYLQKLYFSGKKQQQKLIHANNPNNNSKALKASVKFITYKNNLALKKQAPRRLQSLLLHKDSPVQSLQSIDNLIQAIFSGRLKKIQTSYQIYQQDKTGKLQHLKWAQHSITNMRLLLAGKISEKSGLFEIHGLAYGWNSSIYFDPRVLSEQMPAILFSEGIDFEKSFYQLTEARIIQLEQMIGQRIPFLFPNIKILGSKGMRNYKGRK